MKINFLGLVIAAMFISCQNEVIDNREDWIKEIDKVIVEYEKTAKIESTKTRIENGNETIYNYYGKDSNGFQKIKGYYEDESIFVDAVIEIYLLNDSIVLEKMSGLFPLLYKVQKKETDPCCELFNRLIYYKNSSEGKVYFKHIKIMTSEDKEKYMHDLDILPLVEENGFDIPNEYSRTKGQVEELTKKL